MRLTSRTLAERTGVQPVEQFGDGFVEIGQMEEFAVTQRGYDPALCHLNSCLDLGFIARFVGASGNDREAIMLGQLAVGGIQFRFIAAGMLDCRFRVVGDDDFRRSTKELQSAHMRFDPAGQILAAGGFGKGIAAGAENRDKQRGLEIHFAGLLVIDGDLVASVVNEKLLSGAVVVPENYVEMFHPVAVELAESAVAVAVGMILAILFPEQLQRQIAVTLQLLTNGAEVRRFVLLPP